MRAISKERITQEVSHNIVDSYQNILLVLDNYYYKAAALIYFLVVLFRLKTIVLSSIAGGYRKIKKINI